MAQEQASLSHVFLPEFCFDENLTGEEYKNHVDNLARLLTEERPVRNRNIRVLTSGVNTNGSAGTARSSGSAGTAGSAAGSLKDYLTFIPINYRDDEIRFRLIFVSSNLYEIGIEVDGECTVLYGDGHETYIDSGADHGNGRSSLSEHMEKVKKCLDLNDLDDEPIMCMVGDGYPELERACGKKRSEIIIGVDEFISAVKYLGLTKDLRKNLAETCLQVVRVTQMICEPLRIEALAKFVESKFDDEDPQAPPDNLLSFEHQWANASMRLLSKNDSSSSFPIYYGDSRDDGLHDDYLFQMYKVIKRYDDNKISGNDKRKDYDKSLIYKYLVSCIGGLIKISAPVDLGNYLGHQVSVVKTLFQDHLLLHYNIKFASDNVDVELIVDDSEAQKFQKLDNQPVKSIYQNNIFWTYKKQEGDASLGRFKHTLIEKVDNVENAIPLMDLDIILKDYVREGGLNDFTKSWKKYTQKKVADLQTPYIPLEDAKKSVINLFDMKVEPVNTRRVRANQLYLSGKFMDKIELLVGSTFTTGSTQQVSNIRLEVRYSDTTQDAVFVTHVDSLLEEFRALFS